MNTKREKVAFALFAQMYDGVIDDDPTFPARNWAACSDAQRAPWYHRADAAIAAAT